MITKCYSHVDGNVLMAVFILINRSHPYRWSEVVPQSKYLNHLIHTPRTGLGIVLNRQRIYPKTIQVRRTRHVGYYWRSRDEFISDVLLWTPSHGRTKTRQPARTYIQHLCADTGCSLEDLPEVMNNREGWQERVRDIHADGLT